MTAPRERWAPTSRRLAALVVLVFAWVALWGDLSAANVLSGLVVASVIVVADWLGRPSGRLPSGGIRVGPLARLTALITTDLIVSTFTVAWEVLTPTDDTDEAIVAVELPETARHHLLLLVVGVTVTPGTAVVDSDHERSTLYLHLLHRDQRDAVVARVQRMAELACQAFPVRSDEGDGIRGRTSPDAVAVDRSAR